MSKDEAIVEITLIVKDTKMHASRRLDKIYRVLVDCGAVKLEPEP